MAVNTLKITAYGIGIATIVGLSTGALSQACSGVGKVTVAGSSSGQLLQTGAGFGVIGIGGRSSSSLALSIDGIGQILNCGKSASSLQLSGASSRPAVFGRSVNTLELASSSTGYLIAKGSEHSSLSLFGFSRGVLVETTDGVWVVNLATGGHSRYTGDISGALPVSAYALLPANELGSPNAKFVTEAYAHIRTGGDVEITTVTDEQTERSGYVIPTDDRQGLHRRRVKLAKGIKGTNWQFKVGNISGADFTLKSLEVSPVTSQRTR